MKKKILLVLLMVVGILAITGCAGDNGEISNDGRKKINFYELKYVEPKGFSSESDFQEDRDITKFYFYGQYEGSINLTYNKGKSYSEIEDLYFNEHTEKDINGTTWRVMDNDDHGVKSKFYYTVYNDNFYLIELNGIDKYQESMDEFVKNVSFK